jgi:hypothetical protein
MNSLFLVVNQEKEALLQSMIKTIAWKDTPMNEGIPFIVSLWKHAGLVTVTSRSAVPIGKGGVRSNLITIPAAGGLWEDL